MLYQSFSPGCVKSFGSPAPASPSKKKKFMSPKMTQRLSALGMTELARLECDPLDDESDNKPLLNKPQGHQNTRQAASPGRISSPFQKNQSIAAKSWSAAPVTPTASPRRTRAKGIVLKNQEQLFKSPSPSVPSWNKSQSKTFTPCFSKTSCFSPSPMRKSVTFNSTSTCKTFDVTKAPSSISEKKKTFRHHSLPSMPSLSGPPDAVASPVRVRKPSVSSAPASPNAQFWWADSSVKNSKIFTRRRNNSAAAIQAMVRGHIARANFPKLVEQFRAEHERRVASAAAVRIQALCRGHLGRLTKQIRVLEVQLENIESQKQRELEDIEAWKEQERSEIHDMCRMGMDSVEHLNAEAEKALNLIEELRGENKKLRKLNKKLRADLDELVEENRVLNIKTTALELGCVRLRDDIVTLDKANEQWRGVVKLFEERVEKFTTMEHEVNEAITFEKNTNVLLKRCMANVVQKLDNDIGDDETEKPLLDEVLLLASELPWVQSVAASTVVAAPQHQPITV